MILSRLTIECFLPALLFIMCLLMLPTKIIAQFERDEIKVIHEEKRGPIHFFDGDGDGDLDILQIGQSANGNLLYFENTDPSTPGSYDAPIHSGDTTWWNYPAVNSTKCLIEDMNQDGFPDAIIHNRVFDEQPYFLNEGNGHFSHPAAIDPEQNTSYHFEIGQTTVSGRPDVVVYNWQTQSLYVNENQGLGIFNLEEVIDFEAPTNPDYNYKTFKTIDFDIDGKDDLVFFFQENNDTSKHLTMVPYHNTGETFTALPAMVVDSTEVSSSFSIRNIEIEDVTQDGYPDIILDLKGCFFVEDNSCNDDVLLVLRNQVGNGSFTEIGTVRHVSSSLIIDANQDDQLEVLATVEPSYNSPTIYEAILFSNDSIASIVVIDSSGTTSAPLIHAVDLTMDGYPELLVRISQSELYKGELIAYFESDAAGELEYSTITPFSPFDMVYSNFQTTDNDNNHLIDWDEDGDLDFLIVGKEFNGNNTLFLLHNDGTGHFSEPEELWSTGHAFIVLDFETGNISDDGQIDFIAIVRLPGTGDNNSHRTILGISDAASGTYNTIFVEDINMFFFPISLIDDIDNDGDNDVLLPQRNGAIGIGWNELSTNGGFDFEAGFIEAPSGFSDGESSYWVAYCEDINQDGYKDLAVQATNPNNIYWAHQLGDSGTFEEWQLLPVASNNPANFPFMLRDFDGDSDLDIGIFPQVQSFYDSEAGTFSGLRAISVASGVPTTPVDINMDGTTDIISEEGISLSSPQTGYLTTPFMPVEIPIEFNPFDFFYSCPQIDNIDDNEGLEVVYGRGSIYAAKLDFLPTSSVQGFIRQDTSLSCIYDNEALSIADWVISIENDTLSQVAMTNDDGFYGALLHDTLSYLIRPVPPNAYWEACPPDTLLQAPLSVGLNSINFAAELVTECAILDVEINTSQIRQCFNSFVPVHYTNVGSITLPDAQIEISFDENLTPVMSTLPWDTTTDTTLIFSLNDVGVGMQGDFTIEFMPNCEDLSLGETICFTTSVTPDSLCQDLSFDWDGANLEASAFCESDSLAFIISNTGQGDMQMPQALQVDIINDDIVIFLIDDTELDAGESDTIRVAAMNEVMRLHVDQPMGHPLPEPINLLAQGCDVEELENLGLIFPNEDGNPFVNTFCMEVIGAYDPNIKTTIPEGLGNSHLIEKDWTIDYTIQFQNTGTDHALNVSIRDTLSSLLDLTSFKFKGASHAVDVQLLPNRELHFFLPNINLPDSTSNEPESHGYVSFSIEPMPDAPPLSVIENRAGIYFDFNEVVLTDYVFHTIIKPQEVAVVRQDICLNDVYLGVQVLQDTLIEEFFEFPEKDSIVWHYVTARPTYDTDTTIVLEAPTIYNGTAIYADTSLTFMSSTIYGCDSLLTVHIDAITNTDDLANNGWLKAYPNPSDAQVIVSWDKTHLDIERIDLMTFDGRQLVNSISTSKHESNMTLELEAYPPGLYWLVAHTKDGIKRMKITKT